MSKYICPEDGIKAVTFERPKSELHQRITNGSLTVAIRVNDHATERLKQSCDLLMQDIGAKLLRWSHILK